MPRYAHRRARRRACLIGWLVASLGAPMPALAAEHDVSAAQAEQAAPLDESELMLLEVTLDRHVLSHELAAYHHGSTTFVPLGEVARLLGLAVKVDAEAGAASGYVLDPAKTFQLDTKRGKASLAGLAAPFDAAKVVAGDDDIYVESGLLGRWMSVSLDVDPFNAELKVVPSVPLPLQQFFERETAGARLGMRTVAGALPRLELPYRLWSWPSIDQSLTLSARPDAGGVAPGLRYSTLASGELFFLSADTFVAGNERSPVSDWRASLGRKDPDAGLLGPLKATEVAVGQLALPGLALLAQPNPGLGVTVGNFPLNQPTQFDRHVFQGDLLPGWDVELYRGEQLLAHQSASSDGRFRFEEVPLLLGLNNFKLVFYGPQGQRREEAHTFNVGDTLTPVGTQRYRASATMQADGTPAAFGQLDFGLLPQLSATLGLATLSSLGVRTEAAKLGARGFWGAFFLTGDLGVSPTGLVGQAGLQTTLGPANVSLQHARSSGYMNAAFASGADVVSHSEARVDWLNIPLFDASIGTGTALSLDDRRDGAHGGTASLPLSVAWRDLYASHRLNFALGADGAPRFSDGALQLSSRWDLFGARGDLGWGLDGVHAVGLTLSARRWVWDYTVSAGVSRSLATGDTAFQVNLNRDWGVAMMGLDANTSGLNMGLSSAMSLDPDTGLKPRSGPLAASGAVLARVFFDRDRDGVWDADESPVEGAGISAAGGEPALTDAAGKAAIASLSGYAAVDVALTADSLTDPLWVCTNPGVRLVPRPGRTVTVDFPIVSTGEVNGTVSLKRPSGLTELGGATLELVDPHNHVVATARTAYDGFYTFTGLAPGRYRLRLPPEQFVKRKLVPLPPQDLEIAPLGSLIEGLDLTLEFAHDPAKPAPALRKPTPAAHAEPGHGKPGPVRARPQPGPRHAASVRKALAVPVRPSVPVRPAGPRRRVTTPPLVPRHVELHILDTDAVQPLPEAPPASVPLREVPPAPQPLPEVPTAAEPMPDVPMSDEPLPEEPVASEPLLEVPGAAGAGDWGVWPPIDAGDGR